jgi:hypothetical protein
MAPSACCELPNPPTRSPGGEGLWVWLDQGQKVGGGLRPVNSQTVSGHEVVLVLEGKVVELEVGGEVVVVVAVPDVNPNNVEMVDAGGFSIGAP